MSWKPIRKIVATGFGALTSAGVIAIGHAFGWEIDPTLAAVIVGLASALAGYLTPSPTP